MAVGRIENRVHAPCLAERSSRDDPAVQNIERRSYGEGIYHCRLLIKDFSYESLESDFGYSNIVGSAS
jgi:hypothetical protein